MRMAWGSRPSYLRGQEHFQRVVSNRASRPTHAAPAPCLSTLCPLLASVQLYNAHTVGCDALWAGVPMVTLRGAKMASRVGASLVEAAGMPELVTGSLEEYTQLVLALAR